MNDELMDKVAAALDRFTKSPRVGKSNRPYYRPQYAELVLDKILKPLINGADVVAVPIVDVSVSTLRNQWYQGSQYLTDHLDPNKQYKPLVDNTETYVQSKKLYFRFRLTTHLGDAITEEAWRADLLNLIEKGKPGDGIDHRGLHLTDEDQKWAWQQLAGVEEYFIIQIKPTHIVVYRDSVK